ncbi:MAG TPA: glycosyltransferase family 39 protein [Chthoniobacterales bacterium]|nr:glycosyltransferase family 39 protein [Chthoniobacterales bacterium]
MNATRTIWLFILGLTLVRLSILPTSDLEFDEAHYWMWSDRLAPAYFSKGPGVAFAIRSSTAIFGPNEFGVRFWSPVLAAATTLLLFYFAKRLFGEGAGLWTAVALNVTPIFNIGAFVMTIDPLSIFFWTAAMFTFYLACERSPQFSWWWPFTGFLIGLGFLSKYTNGLEVISVLLVLAFAPRLRSEFKRPGLYLLIGVFLLCTVPAIVWNSRHAWITLAHLRARGDVAHGFALRPAELLKFIGEHFLVYSPLIFLALGWAVIARLPRINQQFKILFLFWFGLPVFIFYFLLSFNKAAAPNWDALAMIAFGLLAAAFWYDRMEKHHWLKWLAGVGLAAGLLMSLVALDTDLLRTFGIRLSRSDPSDRMRGWKSATAELEKIRDDLQAKLGQNLFLIADERDRASEISFYLRNKRIEGPGHPPVYMVESQDMVNQFSFWPRYDEFVDARSGATQTGEDAYTEEKGVNPFAGRSALFIRGHEGKNLPHNITAAFQSTEPVGTIAVERFGKIVRKWQVFLCRNYRTLPL